MCACPCVCDVCLSVCCMSEMHMLLLSASTWVLGTQTEGLIHAQQTLYLPSLLRITRHGFLKD